MKHVKSYKGHYFYYKSFCQLQRAGDGFDVHIRIDLIEFGQRIRELDGIVRGRSRYFPACVVKLRVNLADRYGSHPLPLRQC